MSNTSRVHPSTEQYLTSLREGDDERDALRVAIRQMLLAQGEVLRQAADRQNAIVAAVCDERNVPVRGLFHEAQDKLRTIHRLAGESQQTLTTLLAFLGEEEDFEQRFSDICAANRAPTVKDAA